MIENEQGYFYGPVNTQTDLPSGEGVFVAANGWVHCCRVQAGTYADGRRVSANYEKVEFQVVDQKTLSGDTKL